MADVEMSVEECVYWAEVAHVSEGIGFHNLALRIIDRDIDKLQSMAAFNLKTASADRADGFGDWMRARLLAWALCRAAIRAIERERAGRLG